MNYHFRLVGDQYTYNILYACSYVHTYIHEFSRKVYICIIHMCGVVMIKFLINYEVDIYRSESVLFHVAAQLQVVCIVNLR